MDNLFLASKFAGDILDKRTREDISFTGLVAILDIDRASLWRAESGDIPKLQNFFKICSWLGKPMETYFLTKHKNNASKEKGGKVAGPVKPGSAKNKKAAR